MPRLEYFLLAESASVDNSTGSLSIFNVLNEIRFEEFPATIQKLVAVSGWICDPSDDEAQIKLEFVLPGLEKPVEFRGNMSCKSRHQHYNFGFRDVPIVQAGEILARIYLNDRAEATHTLTIKTAGD